MLKISDIKVDITKDEDIKSHIAKKLRIPESDILKIEIVRKSTDARKRSDIHFVYTVNAEFRDEKRILSFKNPCVSPAEEYVYSMPEGTAVFNNPPLIVGFGPAGMFASLLLSRLGANPVVIEQGEEIDARTKSVYSFWSGGKPNPLSNVQFGEGGAGTFSDGKLTTRIKDNRAVQVLKWLRDIGGAPEEITYLAKPHIGTDKLKGVVKNIRQDIISNGGKILFNTRLINLDIKNGAVCGAYTSAGYIKTENIILAIGHSARNTFNSLFESGVEMEQKPFAVGVRIEHLQKDINKVQYKTSEEEIALGAADYKLTYKTSEGRGVYTFCMCPGGSVVAASSEEGGVVTNGMSFHSRSGENANSALLVQIYPEDFEDSHPLSGMLFQRDLEQKAFAAGGKTYAAPAQTVGSFLKGKKNEPEDVLPSYAPCVRYTNLDEFLPPFICRALKETIPEMGRHLRGFDSDSAILTAIESRSSCSVRILRDNFGLSNIKGLYPAGEGAGYAGGIISSAVDGIFQAENVWKNNA
ncbi:MAG: hypothetical protein VB120_00265 [Lachnospiraceae bacterium]|nr:hypothetical protein [Lachnospiraceae bacterium]